MNTATETTTTTTTAPAAAGGEWITWARELRGVIAQDCKTTGRDAGEMLRVATAQELRTALEGAGSKLAYGPDSFLNSVRAVAVENAA